MTSGIKPQQNWHQHAGTLSINSLRELGKVLVIAPHQDDESLGCGGTIALLRQAGLPVHVAFVSDGSLSHPNSKKYPTEKRIALREQEALAALQILGINNNQVTFMHLPDGSVPFNGDPQFTGAVNQMQQLLLDIKPQTILLPWRRDPHTDHRATWQIVDEAINETGISARQLEYLIWLWERAADNDLPQPGEMQIWQVNIEQVIELKKQAIAAHLSQTTRLIDDDPEGFMLSPEVLAHFDKPYEIFVESNKLA
ncbi:PIG-L family deacetylase [Mucilaginibacter robiniae]|uniref:PIG-L family deacetylase n=1 Tax=Mucilaginibacter robiniae TaxID=2728022 RepID=A0A7L5DXY9_9SPHI|nr:PIG-L family deacetylase [Mucilaginibacter robiniae]QJD95068.1 PIG-L family deacetylase [Mucilaginibacter robiniae]